MRICPHCFHDIDTSTELDPGLVAEVVAAVGDRLVVRPDQIMSHNRTPRVVDARNASIAVVHQLFGLSSVSLGRLFNRDHSTILHSLRRADTALVEVLVDDLRQFAPRRTGDALEAIGGML